VKILLKNIPVRIDPTTSKDALSENMDLSEQIQEAISMFGYNYENKLAKDIINTLALSDKNKQCLKAELLQLKSLLGMEKYSQTTDQLLEPITNLIDRIEYNQIISSEYKGDGQRLYFEIPFICQDQYTTAELEFFRQKRKSLEYDNAFSISIKFNLKQLGYVEFIINIVDKNISCQIKTDKYETYELAGKHSENLVKRLEFLGYDISGIFCTIMKQEANKISDFSIGHDFIA
jgi:hypothetical protein